MSEKYEKKNLNYTFMFKIFFAAVMKLVLLILVFGMQLNRNLGFGLNRNKSVNRNLGFGLKLNFGRNLNRNLNFPITSLDPSFARNLNFPIISRFVHYFNNLPFSNE